LAQHKKHIEQKIEPNLREIVNVVDNYKLN